MDTPTRAVNGARWEGVRYQASAGGDTTGIVRAADFASTISSPSGLDPRTGEKLCRVPGTRVPGLLGSYQTCRPAQRRQPQIPLKSRERGGRTAMPEGVQFRIGGEVRCTGGEVCGEIRYLDVSRDSHTLTHLAVEERGRLGLGRLVPVDDDHVRADPKTDQIEFLGAMARFKTLDPFDVTTFVTGTHAWERYGEEQVVEEPEYDPIPGEQVEGSSVPGFEPVI